jgi:HAD superfamily hydrolase (TIGR01509 family)
MQKAPAITCIFVDIGGVLLTDGWDRHARKRAATNFKLELADMEDRHHLMWDTHQEGKITLEEYLGWVVFYQKRPFTRAQFRHFMFAQSKPYPEMIELVTQLKVRHRLKIAVVSNEGRELNAYRIRKFNLNRFVDFFVSSCFVQLLKPDADIFRLALDIAQVPAEQVVFIDNTPMFVQIAESLGIRGVLHEIGRAHV